MTTFNLCPKPKCRSNVPDIRLRSCRFHRRFDLDRTFHVRAGHECWQYSPKPQGESRDQAYLVAFAHGEGDTRMTAGVMVSRDSERRSWMVQGIYHIGIHADDPAQLALFYRDVLDMQIIGGSPADDPFGVSAFLSNQPDQESHHLAIFQEKQFAHTAFKVGTLADLREFYRRVG